MAAAGSKGACTQVNTSGGEFSSNKGEVTDPTSIILSKLEALLLDLKSVKDKLNKLENDNENTSKNVASFDKNIKEVLLHLKHNVSKNHEDITKLKIENTKLKQEVQDLKSQVANLKQTHQSNSLRITNIAVLENENLKTVFDKISLHIGFTFDVNFIEIYRLKPRNQTTTPPIIVKFLKMEDKINFMQCLRVKKYDIPSSIISNCTPIVPIYISENMTSSYANLFYQARKLKKEKLINSVWFANNKIFLKITENSKALAINDIQDLENILNKEGISVSQPSTSAKKTMEDVVYTDMEELDSDASEGLKTIHKKRKLKAIRSESIESFFRPQNKK